MKIMRLILSTFLCIFFVMPMQVHCETNDKEKIILIDPGHGGIDGGAQSRNGTIEKNINLEISLKLRESLKNQGYTVCMTREEDKELNEKKVEDLSLRCKMKESTKCDVFISIHQNMFAQTKCYGAQVWHANNDLSKLLADHVQNSIKECVNDKNKRIAKCAKSEYKILRDGYNGASIIVECGFLSNNEEEAKLKTEEHQNKIVDGITKGINNYFQEK